MEIKKKITIAGLFYVPVEIRRAFGRNIRIIPAVKAAVFYPEGTDYEEVLASLRLIQGELEQRARLSREGSE